MDASDVNIHHGEFETSINCVECATYYEGLIHAQNEAEAILKSIAEVKKSGWTNGPLCPDCSDWKSKMGK